MAKHSDKRNKSQATPYDKPTRKSTRSTSVAKDKSASSSATTESVSSKDKQNSSEHHEGPSWSDFNKLKDAVSEMHELLKSVTNKESSVNKDSFVESNTNVVQTIHDETNSGVSVDNAINLGQSKPMEASAIPIVVGNDDGNRNKHHTSNVASTSDNRVQTSVDEFLQSFINTGVSSGEHSYREPGRPIDLKVTEKTRQKIWADQYIDLAILLDSQIHPEVGLTIISDPGEPIKFGPSKQNKVIGNLGQWCSAFEIFITVYCQKHPHALSPLMTYMNSIKTLSHRGGDYLTYDQEFRYMRESMNLAWESIHTNLWLDCRDSGKNKSKNSSNNNSDNFRAKSSNSKPFQGKKHPFGFCFRYHSFGKCGRQNCKFNHKCYECEESHPISRCPRVKQSNSNEQTK